MVEPSPPSGEIAASVINGASALGSQLLVAAESGDLESVNRLLRYRAPVNWTDEEGATPLHWAAENGHVDVVRWLLVVPEINVDARTPRDGMTPLLTAVKKGNFPIAQLLLESRPQLDAMAIVDDLCGKIMFASEGATALYMSVTSGSVELAELLLSFGASPNEPLIVRTADPDAGTVETSLYALHAAVRTGDFAMTSLLVAYQANVDASIQFTADDGVTVIDGGTALYGAVNDLQLDMVELLLASGASPNISGRIPGPDGSVVDGWTALHAAVSHGSPELVRLLVEAGAQLDATTATSSPGGESVSEGMTAMCAAAQGGMAEIVKILIKGGADCNAPVKLRSADGSTLEATALQAAIQAAQTEVIDVLLDYDADVHEGTRIAMDKSFDEAKRARVEEANRRLAEGVERTRDRALARAARHSYVLEQRRQAREHAERKRREREKREAAAKKEALLREERRAKAAMEEMLARAKKEAAEEVKAIQKMADGPAKLARIRKIRAKYHPDKNLPGLREQFTQLSSYVNVETDKLKAHINS